MRRAGGRVICDDLAPVAESALGRRLDGLSPEVMQRIDAALKVVADLRWLPGEAPARPVSVAG